MVRFRKDLAMQKLRILAAVVAASAVLTSAGCGNLAPTTGAIPHSADAPHLSQAEFVPALIQAERAAGAVHIEFRMTRGGKETSMVADSSMTPGGSIRVTLLDGLGAYGRPSARKFELRLIGSSMYISVPGRAGKFMQFDSSDPRSLCGCVARHLREAASPEGSVANFRRGFVGLKFLGLVARDGLYLQHYRAYVDPRRLVVGKSRQAQKLPDRYTYDMWLDSDNLVRRMTGEAAGVKIVATYSDWGKRVDLDPPWPKQIVNATRT
jgi:hypothetical protein